METKRNETIYLPSIPFQRIIYSKETKQTITKNNNKHLSKLILEVIEDKLYLYLKWVDLDEFNSITIK